MQRQLPILLVTLLLATGAIATGAIAHSNTGTHESVDDARSTSSAPAAQSSSGVTLTNQHTYWRGQTLVRSEGIEADERVELRQSDGALVVQLVGDDDGTVTIETGSLAGEYVLRSEDGGEIARFGIARQTLSASFAADRVENGGDNTTGSLRIDSNRGQFDVAITAANASAADLQRIFGGRTTNDGAVVIESVAAGDSLDADFDGVAAGAYDLAISVTDTAASDEASITVADRPQMTASFENEIVPARPGEIAAFTVRFDGGDRANVTVGSADVNYRAILHVVDGNGDGEVQIRMNTSVAGGHTDAAADAVFSSADGDDQVTAERETGSLDRPLDSGEYPLGLVVAGETVDVASLFLTSPTNATPESPTNTTPATPPETVTTVTTGDPATATPGQPGFGIAIAVTALIGAAAIALRRRR